MNTKVINNIIENIQNECDENEAYIGFFYDEDEHKEYTSCIKGNKEGLLLFANQLLKASIEINSEKKFEISNDLKSKYSEFYFSHVEYLEKSKNEIEKAKEYKQTFKDQLGCLLAIIIAGFAFISLIVGALTIFDWLF